MLALGSQNFNTSLEELKDHLNFKLTIKNENINSSLINDYDILFIHQDFLKNDYSQDIINKSKNIKILIFHDKQLK